MIAELRDQLVTDLGVLDVPVHTAWPDRVSPPCLVAVPGQANAYVTNGPTFGGYTVSVDLIALVSGKPSGVALSALESLIEGVLRNTVDWTLTSVDSPSVITLGTAEVLGTTVRLSKPARL